MKKMSWKTTITFLILALLFPTTILFAKPVEYLKIFLVDINNKGELSGDVGYLGILIVETYDGTYLLNYPYLIPTLSPPTTPLPVGISLQDFPFNPELVSGEFLTIPSGTYLVLQTQFAACASTINEENIALEFDGIFDPTTLQQNTLQVLANLSCNELSDAFNQMSGEQYVSQFIAAELVNTRFIRRLYDPLRHIITCTEGPQVCPESCEDVETELWLEGGATGINVRNTRQGYGFNTNGYEIAGGAQCLFARNWTLGAAVGYYQDQINYKLPGHSRMSTVLGGLYSLYRPECYYVLGDLTFGISKDKMHRKIFVSGTEYEAQSKSRIYQGSFYTEAGMDFFYNCFLIQPFAGIELGYIYRDSFSECEALLFDLSVSKKNLFKSFSRLGIHFSTSLCKVQLNADLAWLYRLSNSGHTSKERFSSFGENFKIYGIPWQRSSFEGILNLQLPLNDYFTLYTDLSGEVWPKATTWSALGGIQASW